MNQKPRLVPFCVPWMVSPSAPFLRLSACEPSDDGITCVEFVGHFKLFQEHAQSFDTTVKICNSPPQFIPTAAIAGSPYQLVRIVFERAQWIRMSPAHSDGEVVEESKYDWSSVPVRWERGTDTVNKYLDRSNAFWVKYGNCPYPGAYEIENSDWLSEVRQRRPFSGKHFLITGHDSFIEVLAKEYRIQYGQALLNW